MKILLFVEGQTEREALPRFFHRWLDEHAQPGIGIKAIRFQGASEYLRDIRSRVELYLEKTSKSEVLGAIGLLDFYGCPALPPSSEPLPQRYQRAKAALENKVGHNRFRQHFAVHETEAWLFSEPSILPRPVREALPKSTEQPEQVDFDEPPAKLLLRLYDKKLNRRYRKPVDGQNLFQKLSPNVASNKCYHLKLLLEDLLSLARRREGEA
ncbi:MAG: DUF4276 family protein [Candidatus Wallbacteria bacterium]|nr:DUF4276 family protein [Candidatus Wallbacteria bacterium]